ncbi:MAG: hypothetical protein ACLU4J_07405 [Butyricimonas paravirosa]
MNTTLAFRHSFSAIGVTMEERLAELMFRKRIYIGKYHNRLRRVRIWRYYMPLLPELPAAASFTKTSGFTLQPELANRCIDTNGIILWLILGEVQVHRYLGHVVFPKEIPFLQSLERT